MVSFFPLFHHWNALLCPPIGFFLNLLLLWLILHRTPKGMWVHSRVLLQTCILDILLLLIMTMGGCLSISFQSLNVIYIFDGYFIGLYQQLWGDNVQNGLRLLMLLTLGFYCLDTQTISVQFLYRYLVLNRNIKIGLGRYLLLLLPSLIVNLAIFSAMPLIFISKIVDFSYVESELINQGLTDTGGKPVYIAYEMKFAYFLLWAMLLTCSKAISYAVIIFCGHRIVRHLAAHAMSERLKELNRQLSRNLIILATYPFVMDLIVNNLIIIIGLFSISNELPQLLLVQMAYWLTNDQPSDQHLDLQAIQRGNSICDFLQI